MKIFLLRASGALSNVFLILLAALFFGHIAIAQNQPPQILPLNNLTVDESGIVDVSLSATDAEDARVLANPRIVVLGSSTAAGFGVPPDSSWVRRLRKYLISLGKPYSLHNLAVNNYTTYHVLPTGSVPPEDRPEPDPQKNITAALALNPNIIIVHLPSNDLANGYTTAETMANFALLKQQAEEAGALFFITTTQPRNLGFALRQELKNQATQIISTYGAFAIPIFDDLAAADLTIKPEVDFGDNVHVNETGQRLIYERVLQVIDPYLAPQPVSFTLQTPLRFLNIVQTDRRTARLEVRPKFNDAGNYNVTIRATDTEGGVATRSFNISVTDRPPGFNGKWAASQVAGSITHNLNGGDTYEFYIYFPRNYDDDNTPKPILFALHGNEGKANGLEQLIAPTTGAGSIARMASQGTDFPMIVISPKQKNTVGTQSVTSWHVEQLHLLVQHSLTAYKADRDRMYFTGYSTGGHGVWEYAIKYPDFPAAIVPVSGWTNFAGFNARGGNNPCTIKHIPTWIFHGNPDNVVPYSESTQMQSLMNACIPTPNPLVRLTTITGVVHDNIRPVVYPNITGADNIYDWLLQFSKRDGVPPQFTLSPEITGITTSTVSLRMRINEPGRIVWGVYSPTVATPTYSQLQSGTGALQSGSLETAGNVTESLTISGLTFGTAYRIFIAAQDNAPVPNVSAIVALSATTSTEGITWQLQRTVKVNFSNTTVPNLPDWTTINGDAINGTTTFALRDANGAAANINLIGYHNTNNSSHWGTRDNNSTLTNGPVPDAVMRITLATQNTMRFKITGLNPSLRYSFTMHGGRTLAGTGFTDRPLLTVYDFNGRQASLECLNNSKNTVSVEYVQPTANGEIDFSYWGNNADRWGYINGLIINEYLGITGTNPPPAAPANLTASATGQTTVALSWNAVSGATGYHVYRSTTGGFTPSSANRVASNVAANSFNDTGLQASTTYFYMVTAVNANGESVASNQAQATTQAAPQPPAAPANLTASATGQTTVVLSWNAVSGATGYHVYRSTTGGFTPSSANRVSSNVAANAFNDTGLQASTTYFYVVTAVNANGESAASNQAQATTQAAPQPPAAPANLTASATGQTTVALSWNAVSGATGYHVYRSTTGGFTPSSANRVASNVAANAFNDTGLQASTTYFYVVTAVNANGESVTSNQAQATTQAAPQPPAAPANLTASATGQTTVVLSWNAVSGATGYHVYRSTTGGFTPSSANRVSSNVAANAFNDTGLQASTTYFYMVTAVNANGESAASNQAQATTQAATIANGLRGEYFSNMTLSGTPLTRTDANINFNWGSGSPMSGIPVNQFSVRWTGRISATASGVYTFIANTDDGVRLWINNVLIIDRWVNKSASDVSANFTMTAGVWYDFRMEYYENSGNAVARLDWRTSTMARVPVPPLAFQLPAAVGSGSRVENLYASPKLDFKVYPNPAVEQVNILMESPYEEDTEVAVINLLGQIMYRGILPKGALMLSVPTSQLGRGAFIVVADKNGERVSKKIIIK
ncbi:fibronectin type III domain-containing protein [Rhodoflexus caldus]|uniref:fibronectin type III domain-containing protein n=1 Tax=Rhodoflexus caldus TaxID=2891236 RepID=UPI00202A6F74|nr:fibronectin type III domain-containing protein [Rhodoflexus caldus]